MKAVGRLTHPNIVQAFDAREIDGTPLLIMEYVDGLDLAEIVRAGQGARNRLCEASEGPSRQMVPGTFVTGLPIADACELVRRTAVALQCAHEHGLVHRDIKPSNIMLSRAGEVKLLDLGLARFYAGGLSPSVPGQELPIPSPHDDMTGTGIAMGTADYMAPEQASDSRAVDIRADIYSLGCTLYKLVSGRTPFSGRDYCGTLEKMHAHVHQQPPFIRSLVPDVPEKLAAILDRMLAKDPDDRFSTPAEVAEAITPWCDGADLQALLRRALESPLPPGEGQGEGELDVAPQPQPAARGGRFYATIAVLLLLIGGLGFALGIMIRIHKDGKETTLNVAPGSDVKINAAGDVDVTPPGQAKPNAETVGSAPRTVGQPLHFGPVIERVINAVSEGKGGEGLDLTSGKLVDVPKEFGKWSAELIDKWSRNNNVDLFVDFVVDDDRFPEADGQHVKAGELMLTRVLSSYLSV